MAISPTEQLKNIVEKIPNNFIDPLLIQKNTQKNKNKTRLNTCLGINQDFTKPQKEKISQIMNNFYLHLEKNEYLKAIESFESLLKILIERRTALNLSTQDLSSINGDADLEILEPFYLYVLSKYRPKSIDFSEKLSEMREVVDHHFGSTSEMAYLVLTITTMVGFAEKERLDVDLLSEETAFQTGDQYLRKWDNNAMEVSKYLQKNPQDEYAQLKYFEFLQDEFLGKENRFNAAQEKTLSTKMKIFYDHIERKEYTEAINVSKTFQEVLAEHVGSNFGSDTLIPFFIYCYSKYLPPKSLAWDILKEPLEDLSFENGEVAFFAQTILAALQCSPEAVIYAKAQEDPNTFVKTIQENSASTFWKNIAKQYHDFLDNIPLTQNYDFGGYTPQREQLFKIYKNDAKTTLEMLFNLNSSNPFAVEEDLYGITSAIAKNNIGKIKHIAINDIVDYILQKQETNAEEAAKIFHYFFDKRQITFDRAIEKIQGLNFRENICKDTKTLLKLLTKSNPELKKAIQESSLLHSSHLENKTKYEKIFANYASNATTVALLDIDDTLLFTNRSSQDYKNIQPTINTALIQSLLNAGVKDVYLFTDMGKYFFGEGSSGSVNEREELVEFLTNEGLTVHGVIASPDYAWHVPETEAKEFIQDFDKIFPKKIPSDLSSNENFLNLLPQYPTIERLFKGDLSQQIKPSSSFQEATNARAQDIQEKSFNAKLLLEVVRADMSVKGALLKQFLAQKPDWVQNIMVFDDRVTELEGVKKISETSSVMVSAILVNNLEETHDNAISDHLSKIPVESPQYPPIKKFKAYHEAFSKKQEDQKVNKEECFGFVDKIKKEFNEKYGELIEQKLKKFHALVDDLPKANDMKAFYNDVIKRPFVKLKDHLELILKNNLPQFQSTSKEMPKEGFENQNMQKRSEVSFSLADQIKSDTSISTEKSTNYML